MGERSFFSGNFAASRFRLFVLFLDVGPDFIRPGVLRGIGLLPVSSVSSPGICPGRSVYGSGAFCKLLQAEEMDLVYRLGH